MISVHFRILLLSCSRYIMFVFHPNCALPPEGVKFVSAPNIRSTLDMVWTCLSILIICTWSVQCPNLPFQIHPQDWRQRIRLQLHRIWGKTVAMIIGVLLPEVMTAIAVDDWANAGSITRQILPQTEEDHIPWSRAHSFAADMGFFIIKFPENEPVTVEQPRPETGIQVSTISHH